METTTESPAVQSNNNEPKKQWTFNEKTYTDRDEVFDLIGGILNRHVKLKLETSTLTPEEQETLIALLKAGHPNADTKIGVGIDHVEVKSHSSFKDAKCFVLVRTDKSEEDFSYVKCIKNIFEEPKKDKRKRDELVPGCLLFISNVKPDDQSVAKMTELVQPFGNLKKVTQKNDTARVLFEKPESAQKALESLKERFSIELAAGESEEKWWNRYFSMKKHGPMKKNKKVDYKRRKNDSGFRKKNGNSQKKLVQPEVKEAPSKIGPPPAIAASSEKKT